MKQTIINIAEFIGEYFMTFCRFLIVVIAIFVIFTTLYKDHIRKKINENDIITIATFDYYTTGYRGGKSVQYNYATDTILQHGATIWLLSDTGMVMGDKFLVVYSREHPDISMVLRNSQNTFIRFTDSSLFAKYNYKLK